MENETPNVEEHLQENPLLKFIKSTSWSIPFIALVVLLVVFSLRLINNADIGFHLKGGQWILENFKFPGNDVFTYTVNTHEYIDMQWLYQVLIFSVQSIFGYAGLTILNVLFILTTFYLLYRVMQFREVPLPLIIITLFTILLVVQIRFSYRPELISWIGIMLTLFIMEVYYFTKKKNLYLLPIITLVWVNMHGLFMIGLFMMACYILSIWIKDKKLDLYLLKWFGIAILATLVNPYFIKGATYPFYLLTRLDESNIFAQTIFELRSPIGVGFSNLLFELRIYYWTAALSLAFFLLTYRKRKIHEFIILVAFFYTSYAAVRNVPIFMFYAGFILSLCLKDIFATEFAKKITSKLEVINDALAYSLAIAFILVSARVVTGNYYLGYGSGANFGIGLNEKSFPVGALEHLKKNNLNGRILNDIGYGGWLEWQYPNQVFIDGRLEVIKEDLYKEYLAALNNNKLADLIAKYNPQLVIFNHGVSYSWIPQMRDMPGWKIVYLDDNTAVYGKSDYLGTVSMNYIGEFFEKEGYRIDFNDDDINRILDIEPGFKKSDWFSGFYEEHNQYRELNSFALFCLDINRLKEAEFAYLNILDKSNGKLEPEIIKELYFNLGTIYQKNGNNEKALKCYKVAIKYDPFNSELQKRILDVDVKKTL